MPRRSGCWRPDPPPARSSCHSSDGTIYDAYDGCNRRLSSSVGRRTPSSRCCLRPRNVAATLIKQDPFMEQRSNVRGLAHERNLAKVAMVEVPDRPGVAHAVFAPSPRPAWPSTPSSRTWATRHHGPELHCRSRRSGPGQARPRADRRPAGFARDDGRLSHGQGLDHGLEHLGAGLRLAHVRGAGRWRRRHRDHLHLRDPDHSIMADDELEIAIRALHKAFALEEAERLRVSGQKSWTPSVCQPRRMSPRPKGRRQAPFRASRAICYN